jgi:hypothetical protein
MNRPQGSVVLILLFLHKQSEPHLLGQLSQRLWELLVPFLQQISDLKNGTDKQRSINEYPMYEVRAVRPGRLVDQVTRTRPEMAKETDQNEETPEGLAAGTLPCEYRYRRVLYLGNPVLKQIISNSHIQQSLFSKKRTFYANCPYKNANSKNKY